MSSELELMRVPFDFDWGLAAGAHVRNQVGVVDGIHWEVVLSERWSSDKDGVLRRGVPG